MYNRRFYYLFLLLPCTKAVTYSRGSHCRVRDC